MSSSSSLLAAFLLLPAAAGLLMLASYEGPNASDTKQQEAGFRSRVFDVSPTHSADDEEEQDGAQGTRAKEPGAGQWLSDKLAQLEASYQAMYQESEEPAQEARPTLEDEAQPDPSSEGATSSRLSAATPLERADVEPPDVLPATHPPRGAPDAAGEAMLTEVAVVDPAAASDETALTDHSAGTEPTLLASAPSQNPTQAPAEASLSPEEALHAEQLRIAVALERHQAFIISLLPLFLPVPMAADGTMPDASQTAAMPVGAPLTGVDMSGLVVGPVDMVGAGP